MGGRGGRNAAGGGGATARAQTAAPAPVVPVKNVDRWGFADSDDADFHQLYNGRGYYRQQQFSQATRDALDIYVDPNATRGSLYSPSQQLNYAMKEGLPLTAQQRQMVTDINAGMHNIGYNVETTRYARVDFMANLNMGVSNFSRMSIQQIRNAIVGKSFTEDGFISSSYNNFRNAPNGGRPFTDKAVKINYKAKASTQALMAPIGGGGALGEMLFAPNQTYKITGVRFTGQLGRSGGSYYNQIELVVEVG